ncbi:MAG: hypothetical protein OEV93_04080 [Candidatus Moranbacteria bacterium]|nr:hypothetical protein [Candidatus Moranbacteria bacterium]
MLTKDIQLNTLWQKKYHNAQLIIFVFFFLALSYFLYKILFPSEFYTYSFRNPSDKSNSIINVNSFNDSIVFDTIARENFSVINVRMSLEKDSSPLSDNSIKVDKSYLAFFYPQGENISNPDDFEINSLVAQGDSVYIVGNEKKYPIDNPTTFISHGFKWENIKSDSDIDLNSLEKENLFNINDPHPDGTIFKIKGEERYFLIKNNQKHELSRDALKKPNLKKESVAVEKNTELKEKCELSKNIFLSRKYSCKIKPENIADIAGGNYRFNVPNISKGNHIKSINVEFKRDITFENFRLSLKEIRDKVFLRYGIPIKS